MARKGRKAFREGFQHKRSRAANIKCQDKLSTGLRSCQRFTFLESTRTESSQDFGPRLCARKITTWAMCLVEGCVCPLSQFRIVVLSQPMIFATSFCNNPKSNRRLRIASPMVSTSFGYRLSLGFFPLNRTRQKSNATSTTHCHREHELVRNEMTLSRPPRRRPGRG